ncbi:hypothetical protein MUO93_03320 [Candidatus Bathyarchaeota archaeon]|jgi:hypothetical protein|nr:hypothetical protein [Candidatus Bathyarchaeota archaeon]
MTKLGSIVLIADKDVKKSEKTSIQSLFIYGERQKEFEISSDVKSGVTKIKVDIPKVGTFETKAKTTKKKGEKTSLNNMLPYLDLNRKLTASEDVKKSDKLEVSVETI